MLALIFATIMHFSKILRSLKGI